jgi:hypothetical protein
MIAMRSVDPSLSPKNQKRKHKHQQKQYPYQRKEKIEMNDHPKGALQSALEQNMQRISPAPAPAPSPLPAPPPAPRTPESLTNQGFSHIGSRSTTFNPNQGWTRVTKRHSQQAASTSPQVTITPSGSIGLNVAARNIIDTTHICVYFNPNTFQLALVPSMAQDMDSYKLTGMKTPNASAYFNPTRLYKQSGIAPIRWRGAYNVLVENKVLIIQLPSNH